MDISIPQRHTAIVLSIQTLNTNYYLIRFQSDPNNPFHFFAGQYIIFQLPPPKLRHTMSIASAPNPEGTFDILQGVVPGGLGTEWIKRLHVGEVVSFMGPLGRFSVRHETGKRNVFIATGCGIAPFMSMIGQELSTISYQLSTVLYWGMRYETDLFWQEEFAALAKEHPQFSWHLTLSRPSPTWSGEKGRVTGHMDEIVQPNSQYYICGSSVVIGDVRKALLQRGVAIGDIMSEAFF